MIPSSWILLDKCLTSSVCNNKETIGNSYDCNPDKTLTVYTNRGSKTFIQMETFKFLPMEVHLNPDLMANILAIKDVDSITGLHISMGSRKEPEIIFKYKNQIIKFQEC